MDNDYRRGGYPANTGGQQVIAYPDVRSSRGRPRSLGRRMPNPVPLDSPLPDLDLER
jgi:hypothetical protein